MAGEFEKYKERKGLWFWMMLSIAEVVSADPELSARKTDYLVHDFMESSFFKYIFIEEKTKLPMVRFSE